MKKDSFEANYKTLNEIAEKIKEPDKINLDDLVPLVEQATKSYKLCKNRIDSVKQMLDEQFSDIPDK